MGSAQSARRIQPGGASGRAGGFPADLSRSPFLPAPPPARLPPSFPSPEGGEVGARGRGRGWGRRGTAPRPAKRPPPGALPPWRCAATGSGTAGKARRGKVARGGRRVIRGRRTTPPRVLQPPGSSSSPNPGAEGARYPSPRSPPPRWGPGRPSHGATALLSLPWFLSLPVSAGVWGGARVGAGRTVLSAPRASSRRRARGVLSGHAAPRLFNGAGGRKPSARGRRRCRLPTRPVLKHGPRSLTRARVRGSHESRRGAMKVKGPVRGPEVGSRGLSSPPRAHHRPVSPAASGRWSTSVRVRTRKMVNYAWAGRSQRKLWWRSVAVLTCKSVVRPGYRGERLIEPSSSWFPPKFPSG